MNMLDAILSAQNGAAVRQIGSQFGLRDDQSTAALGALVAAQRCAHCTQLLSDVAGPRRLAR